MDGRVVFSRSRSSLFVVRDCVISPCFCVEGCDGKVIPDFAGQDGIFIRLPDQSIE
jgi:hypothetical protein